MLLQPGSLLLVLGVVGLVLAWRGRRTGLVLLTVCFATFGLILLLPLQQWLLLPLEDRFSRPAQLPDDVAGIILLGGAEELAITEARGIPSFNAEMETLTDFIALARRYPDATLAFTGGSGAPAGNRMSEADEVRMLFEQLGFDRPVMYERISRDTYENAVLLKRVVQPPLGSTWLLVTAASHMPRSVGCFRAAGWPVVAWPVAYKSGPTLAAQFRWEDLGERLQELDVAMHEWAGLVVYRVLGRTNALFPGPDDKG
jgi:uncharacterized SAM-binding protein YcdF (DUF218 family)